MTEPVAPAGNQPRPPDPRGVRVTVLAVEDLDVAPAVIEPAPERLVMAEPSTGVGLLGGVGGLGHLADPGGMATSSDGAGAPDAPALTLNGEPLAASLSRLDHVRATLHEGRSTPPRHVLLLDAEPSAGRDAGRRREVVVDGWRFEVEVEAAARAALRERARRGRDEAGRSGPTEVRAIIPGVVVSVSVTAGDEVTAGQQLLVVEAMKMQNELRAPRDGTIERVAASQGATIEVGDLLLVIA